MFNKSYLKQAKKTAQAFFDKMTFKVDVKSGEESEDKLILELKTEEPQILIGERGKTLIEIQMLLGRMLRKQTGEQIYLDLDINEYKKNKLKYLKELTKETADQAAVSGSAKELAPMSSYERRIVHMELANRKDIKTESIGEGLRRRIVIKPT